MASRDEWSRLCKAFGAAARARREQLGLTQEELGYRTDLDRTYISDIERGVRNPTLKVLGRMAKGLRTSAGRLLVAAEGGGS